MVSAKKKTRTVNKINKIKSCFAESVLSSELATMTKTVVSKKKKNKQNNTGWALHNFSRPKLVCCSYFLSESQ